MCSKAKQTTWFLKMKTDIAFIGLWEPVNQNFDLFWTVVVSGIFCRWKDGY